MLAVIDHARSCPREDYERQVGIAGICGIAGLGYTGQPNVLPEVWNPDVTQEACNKGVTQGGNKTGAFGMANGSARSV